MKAGSPLSAPPLAVLVFASVVNPVAMSSFLPALPDMGAYFQVDYGIVQLTVSVYLVSVAILQLVIGPASDHLGRRPVMIASFALFLAGTAFAIMAPTIEALLAARVLQGFAIGGMVLSRAIVRDTSGLEESASRMGYVIMVAAVVPMMAPAIGGLLSDLFGWKSVFMIMFLIGFITLAVVIVFLHETNPRTNESLLHHWRAYGKLAICPSFWGYAASASLSSAGFFAFLGGGPYVSMQIFGLTAAEYGYHFAIMSLGYIAGNFISGRFTRRMGIHGMMLWGTAIATCGMALSPIAFGLGYLHPLSLFLPFTVMSVGMGMSQPSAMAGMVSVRPQLAGSASGFGGTLQMGVGAVSTLIVGALLSPSSGPWPLVWAMLLSSLAAFVFSFWSARMAGTDVR